jgi:hypothetical protein
MRGEPTVECADPPAAAQRRRRRGLAAGSARSYHRGVRQLPELRAELLRRANSPKRLRDRGKPADATLAEKANAQWLDAVIDRFGWPGWAAVGTDGARAAWSIAQHGPPALQRRVLPLLAAAVISGDADPLCLAYLIDRVLVTEGHAQLFGTQYEHLAGQGPVRCPIDHPDRVVHRLRQLGIDPPANGPPPIPDDTDGPEPA